MDGSREPLGLPGPGQERGELAALGPARDHALEHVGQPRQGLPAEAVIARTGRTTMSTHRSRTRASCFRPFILVVVSRPARCPSDTSNYPQVAPAMAAPSLIS